MRIEHIAIDQLKPSPLNVRKKGGKDVGDLTASIRSLGLLQPLLVRPNCEGFDIIAGQRRYNALVALAAEGADEPVSVPCIVMEDGDDARAIEASLAENIARLPMDEIDQFKAFAALRDEGLDVADIAARFGVTERLVEQRLAIAGIIPPILNAYRRGDVGADTLRTLTMATPKQQKAWWTLLKSEEDYAPTGRTLKEWLFGGSQVPVSNALFDVEAHEGVIVADLFGEERYFADSDAFWAKQNEAIAKRKQAYLDAGWGEVVLLDVGQYFSVWSHCKVARKKGGKVFVSITDDGEVTFHEGYLTQKEADRAGKKDKEADAVAEQAKPERAELTSAMRNYLGLHRHAAVRTELLDSPALALRLAVAHVIAGSPLWKVNVERQRADNAIIGESLSRAKATQAFVAQRACIRGLLGFELDSQEAKSNASFVGSSGENAEALKLEHVFQALIGLRDDTVLDILAFVMAETLAAHSPVVDVLGAMIGTDMRNWWTPDQTFFDLLRDKEAINAMLREVAGDITADAHLASTAKVQKKIIADCLKGDGRPKVDNWLPRYMRFPAKSYTGGFGGQDGLPDADTRSDDAVAVADAA